MAPFNTDLTVTAPQLPDPVQLAQQHGEVMKNLSQLRVMDLTAKHQELQNQMQGMQNALTVGGGMLAAPADDNAIKEGLDTLQNSGILQPKARVAMEKDILSQPSVETRAARIATYLGGVGTYISQNLVPASTQLEDNIRLAMAGAAEITQLGATNVPRNVAGITPAQTLYSGQQVSTPGAGVPTVNQLGQPPATGKQPVVKPTAVPSAGKTPAAAAAPSQGGFVPPKTVNDVAPGRQMPLAEKAKLFNNAVEANKEMSMVNTKMNTTLQTLNDITSDPNLGKYAFDKSGAFNSYIGAVRKGTIAADPKFNSLLNKIQQLKDQSSLSALSSGGPSSRVPMGLVEAAGRYADRIGLATTKQEFIKAVNEYRAFVNSNRESLNKAFKSDYGQNADNYTTGEAKQTAGGGKTMTQAQVQRTAADYGVKPEEVIRRAKNNGYTIVP